MMKKTIIITLLLVTILWLAGCQSQAQDLPANNVTNVRLSPIERTALSPPVKTSGIIYAEKEIMLSFKTGGIINNVFVDQGSTVRKGQILSRLNLAEINARYNQAKTGYEKADRDYQRIEKLFLDNVITLEQKQNVQTALDIAKSNLEIAAFNKKHSTITAPADGRILARFSEEGELVSAGHPLFSFGSTEEAFIMKVGIADKDIVHLQHGDKAEVKFDAFPNEIFAANISRISLAAQPGSGMFEVELQLDQKYTNLYSGFIGKAIILPGRKQPVSLIPIDALYEASGKTASIFVANDNVAVRKQVEIAWLQNDKAAVKAGLENLEFVINEGNAYLVDGALINILED